VAAGPTLVRDDSREQCDACTKEEVRRPLLASYLYTQANGISYRICVNHAAATAHHVGIVSCFNPTGKRRNLFQKWSDE
jgi:hypothetical protein